ncbi:hypothetical protein [Methylobacterium iners]|uniref:Uncharacterized protein n=1 Tax=Methylobacterium iners TaxID=418707 RepID=A0ABQ4S7A1_9HYPH|nr:hypothetical protein [Methylobacterium iners]GJD97754.1 hypothetical protein OCOJLMKI_4987 [Methylobacterium iners]
MPLLRDPHVRDLTAWEAEPVTIGYGDDVAGRGSLSNQIARLVGRALRDAKDDGLGRADVAKRMAERLGRPVNLSSLDKWASEAAEEHRIPLDAFAALVDATGQHALLGFLPGLFGFAVVHARYVDLIELQQLQEHEEQVAARKAALLAKVRGRGR